MSSTNGIDQNAIARFKNTLFQEINKAMEQLMTDKIIPVTPIDTGDLRRSLDTKHMDARHQKFIWYSRGNIAPHNLKVHESLGMRFRQAGTGAKYLENPTKNYIGDYLEKVARGMRANGY